MKRITVLLLAVLAVATMAACGADTEVGSEVDTNIDPQTGERLGQETTTTAAPGAPTTAAAPVATTAAPVATTAKPTPTTAKPAMLEVAITVTTFEPKDPRVFVGQQIRYTNKDSETRSVQARDGSFTSGPIPPGGTWIFPSSRPGSYPIEDGTRPYVEGTITVIAR